MEPNLVAGAADLLSNVLPPNAVRTLYQHCMQQVTQRATSLVALGEFDRSVEKRRAERTNLQLAASPDGIADALLRRLQDSSAAGHLHDAGQPRRGTLNLEGGRSPPSPLAPSPPPPRSSTTTFLGPLRGSPLILLPGGEIRPDARF